MGDTEKVRGHENNKRCRLVGHEGPCELPEKGYVQVEVSIHCVDDVTVTGALARLHLALVEAFRPEVDSDIEVELVESAGFLTWGDGRG